MNVQEHKRRLLELETHLSDRATRGHERARAQVQDSPGDTGDASVADEGESEQFTETELDATVLQQVRNALRRIGEGTFAEYRKPALVNLSMFEGAGVFYRATPMEAQLCVGEEVVVVGGGNSAGQAAVFLAETAARVHMLVRGDGLA